jgi:hypothetical protein
MSDAHISYMSRRDKEIFVMDSYIEFEGLKGEEIRNLEKKVASMSDEELLKEVAFCDELWYK